MPHDFASMKAKFCVQAEDLVMVRCLLCALNCSVAPLLLKKILVLTHVLAKTPLVPLAVSWLSLDAFWVSLGIPRLAWKPPGCIRAPHGDLLGVFWRLTGCLLDASASNCPP